MALNPAALQPATNLNVDQFGNPKVTAATPSPASAGYDATVATNGVSQAATTGYTPQATPTGKAWDITPDQTVAGQVKGLIAQGSPLYEQLESRALQKKNERGLINSSMAVGAGQSALYDYALPIAQADASTYNKAAGYNADTANKFTAQNIDATNQSSSFTADATNKANAFNADASNRQLATDQAAINQAAGFGADATNRAILANLDANTRTQLADIEANYKNQLQASNSSAELQKQTFTNITNISSSNQMDQASKDAAVANQIRLLKTGLGVIGGISNLDLAPLLTF